MVTYGISALIIGAILAVSAILFAKNKGTRKTLGWIGAILLVPGLIALASPDTIPFLQNEIGAGGALTAGTGTGVILPEKPKSVICPVEDTTVTLSAVDKYLSTSAGGTHRYRLNGAPSLTVSDAGTLTASPGDSLQILFMNGSASSNYFSESQTQIIPCSGTVTYSAEVIQNGTLTIELFNEEGNLISAPENETLGSGDVVTLSGKLKGTYQRGYPYGGIIIAEYNNTDFDDVIVNAGGSKVSTPGFFTVSNTNNVAKAYSVPAILSNQIVDYTVLLDVKSVDPGSSGDPVLRFYPYNYFINEDTGGSFDGPAAEDEDNSQVAPSQATSFTLSID